MARSEEIISSLDRSKIISLLRKGIRLDERRLTEVRPIMVETGVIQKAEGSAIVKLGNTISIAGVKAEIGTPFSDTPNEGVLIVNAEFLPLASPSFEPGPPDENAIEVARVIDRGIRSSQAISLEDLAIIPGKRVWVIYVDVYVLNHDGNMIDCSSLATIAALLNAKIPKVKVVGENNVEVLDEWVPLPVRDRPVSVTIAKINDTLVVDPSLEEEKIMDCRLTLTVNEKGQICAIQKGIGGSLTLDEIYKAIDIAEEVAKGIRDALPPLPDLKDVVWVVKEEAKEKLESKAEDSGG